MITEFLALLAYLVENCTGVALEKALTNRSTQAVDLQESFLNGEHSDPLEDFTAFDTEDVIFQEFDPPQHLETHPKAWKLSLPTFKKSFWVCLKSVLLLQTVAGSLIGFIAVGIVFLDFSTVTWCYYDHNEISNWNSMPKSVQHLRLTAQSVVSSIVQLWDFCCFCTIFPFSLIKKLDFLTTTLAAAFIDAIYRLNLQMYGIYNVSWKSFPLNGLFTFVLLINHFRIARHFYPRSIKNTIKLCVILSTEYFLGLPVLYLLVYKVFHLYVEQQDEHKKFVIAGMSPLLLVIPKAVSRLVAQSVLLKEILHPGSAHVLVTMLYGISAVVLRVMQAKLTNIGMFVALGIAHAIIGLLERITITMRDHIWEYLYRLIRRQTSRQPKYRTPRSRRLIADVTIQIMMQEATALITALGFITAYQSMYSKPEPFINNQLIIDFFIRASIGLSIDLVLNTISLLIQTRFMNIAVNRVWRKKWQHHMIVNCLVVWVSVLYLSDHLFEIVRNKYDSVHYPDTQHKHNCSFPSFL